jgi:hypothetical protein
MDRTIRVEKFRCQRFCAVAWMRSGGDSRTLHFLCAISAAAARGVLRTTTSNIARIGLIDVSKFRSIDFGGGGPMRATRRSR